MLSAILTTARFDSAVSIPHPNTRLTCPTCGRRFLLDETPTPPFCSERCQLIDLGRWLNEDQGLPFEGEPGETPVEYRGDEEEQ